MPGTPSRKPQRRRQLLLLAALGFVLINAVAFFHAWRFTHFSVEAGTHTDNPERKKLAANS